MRAAAPELHATISRDTDTTPPLLRKPTCSEAGYESINGYCVQSGCLAPNCAVCEPLGRAGPRRCLHQPPAFALAGAAPAVAAPTACGPLPPMLPPTCRRCWPHPRLHSAQPVSGVHPGNAAERSRHLVRRRRRCGRCCWPGRRKRNASSGGGSPSVADACTALADAPPTAPAAPAVCPCFALQPRAASGAVRGSPLLRRARLLPGPRILRALHARLDRRQQRRLHAGRLPRHKLHRVCV